MKFNKLLILTAIVFIAVAMFSLSMATAQEVYKVNTDVNYKGSCVDGVLTNGCTCTLSVINPDGTFLVNEETMNDLSNGWYNYTFTPTQLGTYQVSQSCIKGTNSGTETGEIIVSPSGNSGGSNLGFFFLIVLVIYCIAFIGFFGKNEWVAILGGMGLITLGLYTINNGIMIYKDFITNVFSWTTIGVGAFFALYSGMSIIDENL